jgi:hypothetical protein
VMFVNACSLPKAIDRLITAYCSPVILRWKDGR